MPTPLRSFIEGTSHLRYLMRPVLPAHQIAIVGAPAKSGKTLFCLNWAYRLAGGEEFLGWKAGEPLRVLYVDREMGEWAMRDRLRPIHADIMNPVAPDNLFIECRSRKAVSLETGTVGLANLRAMVEQTEPAVLFLDPLRDLFSGDENDSGVMTKVFAEVFHLADEFGVTPIIVHHSAKPGTDPGMRRAAGDPLNMRGSSRIFDVGSTYAMLERRDGECLHVWLRLRHYHDPAGPVRARLRTVGPEDHPSAVLEPWDKVAP